MMEPVIAFILWFSAVQHKQILYEWRDKPAICYNLTLTAAIFEALAQFSTKNRLFFGQNVNAVAQQPANLRARNCGGNGHRHQPTGGNGCGNSEPHAPNIEIKH